MNVCAAVNIVRWEIPTGVGRGRQSEVQVVADAFVGQLREDSVANEKDEPLNFLRSLFGSTDAIELAVRSRVKW